MTGKFIIFIVCLCLLLTVTAVFQASAETLEEYKERIKKEQEDAEKKKQEEEKDKKRNEESSGDSCNLFGACCQAGFDSGCFESLFVAFLRVFSDIRYADYPYAPGNEFDFSVISGPWEEESDSPSSAGLSDKFWMGELCVDGSYLFGQETSLYNAQAMLNLELLVFHVNLFGQYLFDAAGTGLKTFSANAGFSLPIGNFIMSIYAGVFLQEGFSPYVSFGADMKVFLPGRIIISLYSLFSVYEPFYFIIVVPTIELAFDRFTVGVGCNIFDYNHFLLYGPTLKAAVWF